MDTLFETENEKKQKEFERKITIVAPIVSGITLGTVGYTAWNNEKYAKYIMALVILVIIIVVIILLYVSWTDSNRKGRYDIDEMGQGLMLFFMIIGLFYILSPVIFAMSAYSWYFTAKNIFS